MNLTCECGESECGAHEGPCAAPATETAHFIVWTGKAEETGFTKRVCAECAIDLEEAGFAFCE